MDIIDKKTQIAAYTIIAAGIVGILASIGLLIVGIINATGENENMMQRVKELEIENQELVIKITEIKDNNKKFLTDLNQTIINYLNTAYEQSEQQTSEKESIPEESK